MGHWMAAVGIVKIKEEYREQFGFLFRGEYDRLTDPRMRAFAEDYFIGEDACSHACPVMDWRHFEAKPEWKGRYQTAYEDGILTYGTFWDDQDGDKGWMHSAWYTLLFRITEERIAHDEWDGGC
jgi:hypothetical protein